MTHDLGIARHANRVVHMRDGEIVADEKQTSARVRDPDMKASEFRELLSASRGTA